MTSHLEEADKILKSQPNHEAALAITGIAHLKKGEADKALASFKRAQQVNLQNPEPLIDIGTVYVLQKKYSEAIKEYEEALKLAPDRIDALGSLAQLYFFQGNEKAAIERTQRQLQKTKRQADVYQLLGQLSLRIKEYPKAIEYLQKAINFKSWFNFSVFI
jgi:tetratricopeptide (TPR) repeat protein